MPAIKRVTNKARKLFRVLSAGDRAWIRALRHGTAPGVEHVSMLRQLACQAVVDVGANQGQFALAIRHCFPTARIISFEPLPGPAGVFRRVFSDDAHTSFHQAAIGPNREITTMHISQANDSSSLLPISSVQTAIFPGTREVATVPVQVGPLDEFVSAKELRPAAMLKLDVQGFEYEALVGCESLLQHFSYVYCECSFMELYSGQRLAPAVIDWLSFRGFGLTGVYNPYYDRQGRAVQADFLFKRDKNN